MKLDDFINELWMKKGLSRNTLNAYKADITLLLEQLDHEGLSITSDNSLLAAAISKHVSRYSESSQNRKIASFRAYFHWLLENSTIKHNPVYFLSCPKVDRIINHVFTAKQLAMLLGGIDTKTKKGARDRAMFELLYGSGLRVSELIQLKVKNIDLTTGVLDVKGKGDKYRKVPMGEEAVHYLNVWLAYYPNAGAGSYIFTGNQDKMLTRQAVWRRLKHYLIKCGLQLSLSPHSMRHAFATHMLDNGADIRSLQLLLGHASISTTQLYTHVAKEKLISFHNRHHPRG